MKRVFISIVGAAIVVIGMPSLLIAILPPGPAERIAAYALGWPSLVFTRLGIGPDCVNADGIPEKLQCGAMILLTDLIVTVGLIGVVSYFIYRSLARAFPLPEPMDSIVFESEGRRNQITARKAV